MLLKKIEKDGKPAITVSINNLSIKDAEDIGRDMGALNADILNGKIENKNEEKAYQFFCNFATAFFVTTMIHAPESIKKESLKLLNKALFKVKESHEENKPE